MNRCRLEGEWRAWLDHELPAQESEAAAQHLQNCQRCAALCGELSGRAARVGALLGALDHIPEGVTVRPPAAPAWGRRGVAAALVLAAALASLLLMLPRRIQRREPAPEPRPLAVALAPPATVSAPPARRPVRSPRRAGLAHKLSSAPRAPVQYYLALDDEPIESGVVVRVALANSGLLADVIYDEQGRPRAVRPLN